MATRSTEPTEPRRRWVTVVLALSGIAAVVVGCLALLVCMALGGATADGAVTSCGNKELMSQGSATFGLFPFGVVCHPSDGPPVQWAGFPDAWILSGVFVLGLAVTVTGMVLVVLAIVGRDRTRNLHLGPGGSVSWPPR